MTNPNDPVYPVQDEVIEKGRAHFVWKGGLTKREEFAKAAMIGLLASQFKYEDLSDYALKARVMADALIAELNKEPKS